MITLNQETIDAFSESGFEPVVHVTIDITESDASHTYLRGHNYSGSLASTVEGDHIVSTVEVVAPSLDAFERTTEIGSARIEFFSQDVFRAMMNAGKKFLNADVTIRLGAPHLALNRYTKYFNGFIDEVETTDQTVLVTAKEYTAKISERMNLRTFVDDHPIEVIKKLMIDSGIPDGKIDSTTFVHDAFSSISHYAYSSRGASYGSDTYEPDESQVSSVDGHHNNSLNPEGYGPGSGRWPQSHTFAWRIPPADFISEACKMMRVSMFYDSAQSEYKLVQYDSSRSAVRHFTTDEYTDFDKKKVHGPFNRTEIQIGNTGVAAKLTLRDATSIALYGERSYSNTSQFLSPCSFYIDQSDVEWGSDHGGPDTNKVYCGQGFAGTRDIVPEGSQPAASKISASNPFYGLWRQEIIKCTSPHNPEDGGYEWQKMYDKNGIPLGEFSATISGATRANPCVITATAHGFDNGDRITITGVNGMTDLNGNSYLVANKTQNTFELAGVNSSTYGIYSSAGTATLNPSYLDGEFIQTFNQMVLNGVTRAFGGAQGTATDAQARGLYDITAAYDFSQYVLTRFSNGAPEIEFFAPLHHIDIELGDLITIDHDTFLDIGLSLDGLNSNVKFEITGKEVHALGDAAGIQFTAVYATKTSPPGTSIAILKPPGYLNSEYIGGVKFGTLRENSSTNSIKNGLIVSAGSGLTANIAAGEANFGGKVRALPAQASLTMTASKHTYVGINGITGRLMTSETATSTQEEPPLAPTEIRLAKVVTDGSSITSVSDLRQFGNISVEQINPQAVKPGDNLVWNPSFDIWPNTGLKPPGWTIDSGVMRTDLYRSSSGTHSGPYRLRTVDTSTVVTLSSNKVPINRNRPHRASAWVFQDSSHAITLKILWWKGDRTASSTASSTIYSASPTDSEWVNISGVASPPSDAVYASLEISRAANPGDEGMWDDVFLGEEPVSFSVYGAATTAPGTKSAFQVKYNNESHDYGGNYDHSGSNYDFEAPSAGVYEFSAAVKGTVVGAFTYLSLMIYKNGSVLKESYGVNRSVGTLQALATVETGPIELAKGDLITVYMHPEIQTSFTLSTGASETYFSGRKIS